MDPSTRNALLITAVAVLALGLAAATIDSPVETESGSSGGNATEEEDGGLINLSPEDSDEAEEDDSVGFTLPERVGLALMVLSALITLVVLFYYWREALGALALLAGFLLFIWIAARLFSTPPQIQEGADAVWGIGSDDGVGDGSDEATETDLTDLLTSPLLFLGVFGLIIVIGTMIVYGRGRLNPAGESSEKQDAEVDGEEAVAMGEIAGRAADRIEEDAVFETQNDNEVYRAWDEMIEQLDVSNPESATPREFATAAVDAGMTRSDVDELTELFEEVRYGGYDPTTDREERAVTVLRRIESRYGEST